MVRKKKSIQSDACICLKMYSMRIFGDLNAKEYIHMYVYPPRKDTSRQLRRYVTSATVTGRNHVTNGNAR